MPGNRPAAVLTKTDRGLSAEDLLLHLPLQAKPSILSSRSSHTVVEGATHVSLAHNPPPIAGDDPGHPADHRDRAQ
jgi:hypothetical protein